MNHPSRTTTKLDHRNSRSPTGGFPGSTGDTRTQPLSMRASTRYQRVTLDAPPGLHRAESTSRRPSELRVPPQQGRYAPRGTQKEGTEGRGRASGIQRWTRTKHDRAPRTLLNISNRGERVTDAALPWGGAVLTWLIGSFRPPWHTFRRTIIATNSTSLKRSTTSWQDSWKRLCLSNFLNTELLISAKLLEMSRVSNACSHQPGHDQSSRLRTVATNSTMSGLWSIHHPWSR